MPGPCRAFPCSRAPSAAPAPAALAPPPSYAPPEKPRIWSLARTAGANAARRGSPEGCGTEEGGGAVGELPPAPEAPFRSSAFSPQPVPRSCASHRGLGQPCQYAAAEGTRFGGARGRGERGGRGCRLLRARGPESCPVPRERRGRVDQSPRELRVSVQASGGAAGEAREVPSRAERA